MDLNQAAMRKANRLRRLAKAQRFVCEQEREQWRQRLIALRERIERELLDAAADAIDEKNTA